jgi:hypothetical protein
MKKIIAVLLVGALLAGCTGSFRMTRNVYDFHRGMDNKWMDELMFMVVAYLPVYALAILGDVLLFNMLEFWTNENPLDVKNTDGAIKVAREKDCKAVMRYNAHDGTVRVDAYRSLESVHSFVIARTSDCVMIKNVKGDVIYSSSRDAQGGVSVYDSEGKLVKYFPADEVQLARENRISERRYSKLP